MSWRSLPTPRDLALQLKTSKSMQTTGLAGVATLTLSNAKSVVILREKSTTPQSLNTRWAWPFSFARQRHSGDGLPSRDHHIRQVIVENLMLQTVGDHHLAHVARQIPCRG